MLELQIAIVGTGALGESLALALKEAGYPVHSIISRNAETARALAETVGAPFFAELGGVLPDGIQLFFLCVPDDVIASTSQQLSLHAYTWGDVYVAHTSGALTASSLETLADKGARAFSFHPMQTFTREQRSEWDGIVVSIEGHDDGIAVGEQLATSLGSIPLRLNAEDKVLYHASAVFASNFLVTLIGIASDILDHIHINRTEALKLLGPLIQKTCQNLIASGPEQALTGPASRGDIQTIKRHAQALGNSLPDKYNLYLELTKEAVDLRLRHDPAFKEKARLVHKELDQLLDE